MFKNYNIKTLFLKIFSYLNIFKIDFFEKIFKIAFLLTGRNSSSYNIKHEFLSVLIFIKKVNIFIDIGANKGLYSDLVLKHNNKANAFLIEPNKKSSYFLNKKYLKKNNIKVLNFSLGLKSKKKTFYSSYNDGLDTCYNRKFQINYETRSNDIVFRKFRKNYISKCFTFKEIFSNIIFKKKHFNYFPDVDNKIIDLVKIDTEGSELDILKSMGSVIKKIRIIQFEFGSSNIDTRNFFIEFYILLKKNKFDIYRITPGIPREIDYSYLDENFNNANYIAVNKVLK